MSFSKIISIILHPVFIPVLTIYIIKNFTPIIVEQPDIYSSFNLFYSVIIFCFIFLPLITTILFIKFGYITSIEMPLAKERFFPLIISALYMLAGFIYLTSYLESLPFVKILFFGAIMSTVLAALISFFWKISLHMISMGGMLGIILASHYFYTEMYLAIICLTLVSIVLAIARIKEKAHSSSQIIAGFILGLFVQVFLFFNYLNITLII